MSIAVAAEDPAGADALALVAELSATLAALTGATGQASFDAADVLGFLEREAAAWGYAALRLSTRRVNARAVAFYERHGYVPIDGYGRYAGSAVSVCFEKRIGA